MITSYELIYNLNHAKLQKVHVTDAIAKDLEDTLHPMPDDETKKN